MFVYVIQNSNYHIVGIYTTLAEAKDHAESILEKHLDETFQWKEEYIDHHALLRKKKTGSFYVGIAVTRHELK